jgi:hypothetical protein
LALSDRRGRPCSTLPGARGNKALNYDTSQYVTLGSSSVQAEKGAEYAAPDVAPPGRQPYIDPLTKEIKLQIAYSAGQCFSVWIDRAEVRAR